MGMGVELAAVERISDLVGVRGKINCYRRNCIFTGEGRIRDCRFSGGS